MKSVQRMLGHASATLTLDRYGHLFADELDDVAARLDDAMRDADVVPMWSRADPTLVDQDGQGPENGRSTAVLLVPPAGFEPATHGLGNRRSIP